MKKYTMNADLMLILVAVIWGTGFIAVEYAINAGMSAALILATRFTLAAVVLLVVTFKDVKNISKSEWIKGSIAGVLLFLGFYLQTIGQTLTTVSNSAFLTTTNVIMVPFIVWIIAHKKPSLKIVLLALLTFIGVTILTWSPNNGLSFNIGDIYILFCAVAFACHIAYVELAVKGHSPIRITFIQISVAAILSLFGLIGSSPESFTQVDYALGLPSVIFLGLFSTSLCFFMQTSAQKRTSAAKAGIIMSTEGFFGTLFSIILGIEPLTMKIVIGGIIIITAVILTEVPMNVPKLRSDAA